MDDNQLNDQVAVYPNPASTTICIDGIANGSSIAVYDITGRKVMERPFANELSIDILPNGLYLLNITTAEGNLISKKIMISK